MNVVSVLSFAVPTIVVGSVFGSVLGAIAAVSAWLGWKWDLAGPKPRNISRGHLLKRALLAFGTYLALELLLPWIGLSVPIMVQTGLMGNKTDREDG
jgi:hypothetical protein